MEIQSTNLPLQMRHALGMELDSVRAHCDPARKARVDSTKHAKCSVIGRSVQEAPLSEPRTQPIASICEAFGLIPRIDTRD